MFKIKPHLFSIVILINFFVIYTAKAKEHLDLNSIEENLSIATLMSNTNSLKFGFANYDLQINDPGFGTEETQLYKNGLDAITIPYTWELEPKSDAWDHAITVRAYYISSKRNNEIVAGTSDQLHNHTFGLYGNYSQYFHITDKWYVESAFGTHLTFYKNNYDYGDGVSNSIKSDYDGQLFNTTALVAMIEPQVGIGYKKQQQWGTWRAHHNINYVYGHGIGGSVKRRDSINPEAWHITNGIEFNIKAPNVWGIDDFFSIDFKRVEVIGDLDVMAEKSYYYETSFGWVIDTNNAISLLDNIGFGLAINYGSSVSGGSLILYFNE
ncbi:Solitary outer membrane autotransporter beta-barrel domain [Psychromonas algicola]|uniref:Solitary outer membrane autotransporter beta-barrel domain n=1 Tax=Psychromonas algicola TaxID=2555642 RepID=UPI001419664C|nr:Solitary outer membrane autotransporter beta-barrel domain [Psychromonas sp. RZ5]